jgi:nitroreductase
MNETIKTIMSRRSVRSYKDKPIEKNKIEQIIQCGLWAPSARNLQPWKFVAVTDKKLIKDVAEKIKSRLIDDSKHPFVKERAKTKDDPIFYSAPLVIFILGDKENKWSTIDCSLATENMMLAASSLGISSCPIGVAKCITEEKDIIKKLGFPEGYELVITLVFGYADEEPKPQERNKDTVNLIE